MKQIFIFLLGLMLLSGITTTADATFYTYEFSGTIDGGWWPAENGPFAPGTTFSGNLTYDTNYTFTPGTDPNVGIYTYFPSGSNGFQMTFNTGAILSSTSSGYVRAYVYNDSELEGGADAVRFVDDDPVYTGPAGYEVTSMAVGISDPTANWLTGPNLPTALPWGPPIEGDLYLEFFGDSLYHQIGHLSSLSLSSNPAPEPATLLLFVAGLLGLAGFGRKKFENS